MWYILRQLWHLFQYVRPNVCDSLTSNIGHCFCLVSKIPKKDKKLFSIHKLMQKNLYLPFNLNNFIATYTIINKLNLKIFRF